MQGINFAIIAKFRPCGSSASEEAFQLPNSSIKKPHFHFYSHFLSSLPPCKHKPSPAPLLPCFFVALRYCHYQQIGAACLPFTAPYLAEPEQTRATACTQPCPQSNAGAVSEMRPCAPKSTAAARTPEPSPAPQSLAATALSLSRCGNPLLLCI